MGTKKIVVLTGLKGAGKDEIAKVLGRYYGYKKIAFADRLKDVVSVLYGWPREAVEGTTPHWRKWREEEDPIFKISPRKALQKIGTDLVRNQLDENMWVKCVLDEIDKSPNTRWVVTDCRFPNEIQALKSLGTKRSNEYEVHFWRVERGERPFWWRIAEFTNKLKYLYRTDAPWTKEDVHPSERSWQGLDNPEVIIYNNGTLLDLKHRVLKFATKHLKESRWKILKKIFF